MYDQEKVLSFARPSIGDCLFDFSKGVDVMLIKRPAYFAHNTERAKDYRIMEISSISDSSPPSASPSDDRAASPAVSSPPTTSAKLRAVCKFCGKSFVHLGDYNKHQRKHTGERPYSCAECPLKFGNASNLARHRRLHSGEKPFECPTCSRGFSRRDKLAAHVARRCCKPAVGRSEVRDTAS